MIAKKFLFTILLVSFLMISTLSIGIPSTANDSLKADLEADGSFTVDVRLDKREIVEGEEAVINYTIQNTKVEEDTQDIQLTVYHRDEVYHEDVEENVTISSGNSYESQFVWTTGDGDAGRYTLEVSTVEDSGDGRLTVLKADAFTVETRLEKREIVEGEEAVINYTIQNTKSGEDTQDIQLTIYHRDEVYHEDVEKDVTISAGGSYDSQFIWSTGGGDQGRYALEVSTMEDRSERRLAVLKPDAFTVNTWLEKRDVVEGEEAVLNFTIKNTKTEQDTQDIRFKVLRRDEVVHQDVEEGVTISSMDSYESHFAWNTVEGDEGRYSLEVSSEEQTNGQPLEVMKADSFTVQTKFEGREITEGEEAVINYTIKNTKSGEDTQDVQFTVLEKEEVVYEDAEGNVTISPGDTYKGQFTWSTREGDAADHPYILETATEDDEEETHIEVLKADSFNLRFRPEKREIIEGQDVVVNYTVKNTGIEDTQDIQFEVRGMKGEDIFYEDVESALTLGPGESFEGKFVWKTEEGDEGRYEVEVASEDDEKNTLIEVLKADAFTVGIELERRIISEGEEAIVTYVIKNTGERDTQDIEFSIDGEVVETNTGLELGANDTYEDRFIWRTEEGDAGDHVLEVASGDDADDSMLTVEGEGGDDGGTDGDQNGEIPGFKSALLLSVIFISVVIYYKKER